MLNHLNMDDINHKYAKSIIFYDGLPVYCNGGLNMFDENKKHAIGLQVVPLGRLYGDINAKSILAVDPKFADGPFNLGYVNGIVSLNEEGDQVIRASFCTRMPIRRWKQGLTSENLCFTGGVLSYNKALKTQGFVDMLTNTYPTFKQAWALLDEKMKQIAYHRRWAVGQNKLDMAELYYRGKLVGTDKDMRALAPSDKFAYLAEAFELSKKRA